MAGSGSGRRTTGGVVRHRLLAHVVGRVRGRYLGTGSCPLESLSNGGPAAGPTPPCGLHCPLWSGDPAANGHNGANGAGPSNGSSPNGAPEFRMLAALRNWNLARPYFRGRRALAIACPGARGPGERACPLALRNPDAPVTPQAETPLPARPQARPGDPRHSPPAAAAPIPSAPRTLALSPGGSRHAD